MSLQRRDQYERCYWLLETKSRVGTIALDMAMFTNRRVRVSSLYVLPPYRHSGVGRRSLARVEDTLAKHRFSIRLDTSWCWQRTVRFYLDVGMWVQMWKRDLVFSWDVRMPRPRIDIGDDVARLTVTHRDVDITLVRRAATGIGSSSTRATRGATRTLASAKRTGTRRARCRSRSRCMGGRSSDRANSTSATATPMRDRRRASPTRSACGRRGIGSRGGNVDAPRVPGIAYPTWDELETRWAAETAEYEAKLAEAEARGDGPVDD